MNGDSNRTPDDDRDLGTSDAPIPGEVTAADLGSPDDDHAGVTFEISSSEAAAAAAAGGASATASAGGAAELQARIATLETEKKDAWDKMLRAAADLENLRKRQRREVDEARLDTKMKVLKEMLPVVDNLDRALQATPADNDAVLDGVRLVQRQFIQALERLEVVPIDAEHKPFDPNLHEAISQQESAEHPPGTVIAVLQRGYKAGDRLLRPSLVVVAKAKAG
jgi:molecular chaperone GrpE